MKFFSQAKVALFGNIVVAYLVVFQVVLEFRDVCFASLVHLVYFLWQNDSL